MKRIILLLTVALTVMTMVLVTAVPAFAVKGGFGKATQTGECQDPTQIDCSITTTGKQGNIAGGPGRSDVTFRANPGALGTEDELVGLEGTSSGGGGRCTFDDSFSGKGTPDINEQGTGKDAPCPDLSVPV